MLRSCSDAPVRAATGRPRLVLRFPWQRHIFAATDVKSQVVARDHRTEQRTLNPRVRGSSPWRRTRDDLGLYRPQVFFLCPVCPDFAAVLAPCLLGGRMLAGGRLVKNGPIGLDQLSGGPPTRLHSAITAGTDTPPGCRRYRFSPAERLAPRPADSIRTFVARHSPGCACLPVSDTGHGPLPPDWPRGRHAEVYRRYTGGTSALWPVSTWWLVAQRWPGNCVAQLGSLVA